MSLETDMLMQSVNGSIGSVAKRIDTVELAVSQVNHTLGKIIENQQKEIDLLQKLVETAQSQSHTS
jgi:hypothetical protein